MTPVEHQRREDGGVSRLAFEQKDERPDHPGDRASFTFGTLHMKRTGQLLLLCLTVFLAVPAPASETGNYRLAGTINAGDRGWLAVLELADGEQYVLSKGERFPGGEVLDIGDKWLRLQSGQGELTLSLEGGMPGIAGGAPPPGPMMLEISESLKAGLDELGASAGEEDDLARGISELLEIPATGRVATVDDQPASSAKHTLQLLRRSLVAGTPVRIEVSGVEGTHSVYLMPAPPPEDAGSVLR